MAFRFADFELDEDRRELHLRGQALELQPLVFDLLCYLVRNRDRVVSKEELLDELWPDTQVTEGSLQRAVSLARRALKQGDAADVIRNFPKQGYRFCAREQAAADSDWAQRCEQFRAKSPQELSPAELEEWSRCARWAGRMTEAIEALELAVSAHDAAGDPAGAARACVHLARLQHDRMDLAVASAWVSRADSFLEGVPEGPEHAWAAWIAARVALKQHEHDRALSLAGKARELAGELGVHDIELAALHESGHIMLTMGLVKEGLARLDEAAAGVLSSPVDPEVGGIIYCGVIYTAVCMGDWKRAGEWTDHFTRWCTRHSVTGFPGVCQLHRAELMHFRGDFGNAEREFQQAFEVLPEAAPWAEGDAYRVLGDIQLSRGELDAAGQSYRKAYELGWDPQPGFALLQFSRGEVDASIKGLEAALEDEGWFNRERRGLLLAHLARIAAMGGREETAEDALARFDALGEDEHTPANLAHAARARAELANARGDHDEAGTQLRKARRTWTEIGAPFNAAGERLRLAQLLIQQGDRAGAELELGAAESVFKQAGISTLLEDCRKQLAELGSRKNRG